MQMVWNFQRGFSTLLGHPQVPYIKVDFVLLLPLSALVCQKMMQWNRGVWVKMSLKVMTSYLNDPLSIIYCRCHLKVQLSSSVSWSHLGPVMLSVRDTAENIPFGSSLTRWWDRKRSGQQTINTKVVVVGSFTYSIDSFKRRYSARKYYQRRTQSKTLLPTFLILSIN